MKSDVTIVGDDSEGEVAALVRRLHETQQRLQELAGGEVDAVMFPGGQSFLLHEAQEKLRQGEVAQRQLAATQMAILNALPAHIALIDHAGVIISVNEAWRRFAGANALQGVAFGVGQDYLEVCDRAQGHCGEEAQAAAAGIRRVLRGEIAEFAIEYPCHSVTEQRWFRLVVTPLREDRLAGAVVMHVNITAAKNAEQQIREQAALLDQAQDAIVVHDLAGVLTYWNKGAERLFGWTGEEILGCNLQELLYENPESYELALAATIGRGAWSGSLTKRTKLGVDVIIDGRWTLLRDDAGQPKAILAINTNITERREVEAQLFRAQRMESIGTLAGGIAHDLNNVLGPIIMAVDLLKMQITDPKERRLLEMIETSGRHGAEMVKQVLYFARGATGQRVLTSPAPLVKELQQMARDTFPKTISVEGEVPPEIWSIPCDPTQIHQVLLNLCVNARDAMPAGGKLRISARNRLVDEQFASMRPNVSPGLYVVLEVTDTGEGMPPEVVARMFDPFFTTKEIGRGTGLGLSTTQSIVQNHGGFISVNSAPGKGTSIEVNLPAETGSAAVPIEAVPLPHGRGETILIIDDEASVRSITGQTLETFGYRVLTAIDGADGVAKYAEHMAKIAAVVTDMMMPVMDGPAMIAILMRLNPAVKIIAVSGLGTRGGAAQTGETGVKYFLQKPYTAESLLQTLDKLLHPKK
ncbi:MAG: PAS domain S-box protein [Chthoniobacteraceae bacterium]